MIIVIASFPGTETKKICKSLALRLGLRHFGKEEAERKIKEKGWEIAKLKIQEEEKKGNFITESMIAGKQLKNPVRVFLYSSKRSRAKEISEIEKIPIAAALERIEEMEKSEEKSIKAIFGSEYFLPEEFDLVLNADRLDEASKITLIEKFLEKIQK